MTPLPYFLWIKDWVLAVGPWGYDGDAALVSNVSAQSIGIVGFISQNEVALNNVFQGVYGTEAIMLVATNELEGDRESDKIHRHRKLGVSSAFRFPKLLFISWKRMLGGVLMRFDMSRVEHHGDQKILVPAGDLLDCPSPQTRTAPSPKATPYAVPFTKPFRHLIPHRPSASYPPDAIKYPVEVEIRATATAAYFFPVSVLNFFSSSRTIEGISSDLNFDTIQSCESRKHLQVKMLRFLNNLSTPPRPFPEFQ